MLNYLRITHPCSVTPDINLSAEEVNDYLAKINNCAFQWKMNFNPDSCKQAQGSISLKTVFKTP